MKKAILYIYLLSWVLYKLQDVLYSNSIISTISLSTLVGISFLYFVLALSKLPKTNFIKGLVLLIALFSFYGIMLIMFGEPLTLYYQPVPSYYYLKYILLSLLPFFPFYYFFQTGILTSGDLKKLILLFLVIAIVTYFENQQNTIANAIAEGLATTDNNNNAGYSFLLIIPALTVFSSKPRFQYLLLMTCVLFIVFSMKRGAMLIGVIVVLIFMLSNIKRNNNRSKLVVAVFTIMVIVSLYFSIDYLFSTSEYFVERYNGTLEGDSSHRDELYSYFINHFIKNPNTFQQVFGEGANATLRIYVNYAHNDWIEILINQGIFGVICYLCYWLCFYKDWRLSKKLLQKECSLGIGLFLLTFFSMTLFSSSYASISFSANCFMAYYISELVIKKEQNIVKTKSSVV